MPRAPEEHPEVDGMLIPADGRTSLPSLACVGWICVTFPTCVPGQMLMVGTSDLLNQTSTYVKLPTEFKHIIIMIPQVTACEKGQSHHVNLRICIAVRQIVNWRFSVSRKFNQSPLE